MTSSTVTFSTEVRRYIVGTANALYVSSYARLFALLSSYLSLQPDRSRAFGGNNTGTRTSPHFPMAQRIIL